MLKWSIAGLCLAGVFAAGPAALAQALPSATRGAGGLQIGVGATFLSPDYRSSNNGGVTVYADYDALHFAGVAVGAEGIVHLGGIISPKDIAENTYLGGPRASYRFGKLTPYAKAVFGRGTIEDLNTKQSSAFFTIAYGGGVDYLIKPHFNIRCIDFEGQKWPGFEPHTLSPYNITVGVAYVFH